ncbi:hypothetical protein ACEU07_21900 [Chromobacterium violaceum]|uniref:hypothetical protein n=1 Tax=Chromobacterium violaceum TaxID=536 RepID=UPI0035A69F7A
MDSKSQDKVTYDYKAIQNKVNLCQKYANKTDFSTVAGAASNVLGLITKAQGPKPGIKSFITDLTGKGLGMWDKQDKFEQCMKKLSEND